VGTSTLLTAESCRNTLRRVIDPEIYQNIVDLGLVYGVAVDDADHVTVTMTLTTPHCPMGPQILENVERVLKEDGAGAVTVNIVWDPLWTPEAMTDALKRELGILPPEDEGEVEPQLEIDLPPPPAVKKKKGLLGWILGS